jgi:shikimate kinase
MRSHVFLIGFMGSGKSTVGKVLAELTGFSFMDTDRLIASRAARSIPWIFAHRGETAFRDMETALLEEIAGDTPTVPFPCRGEGCVVAAGGGMVCRERNLTLMKEAGVLVYLRAGFDDILRRIGGDPDRPVLGGRSTEELEKLLRERERFYLQADHTIGNDDTTTPRDTALRIARLLDLRVKGEPWTR